MSKSLYLSVVDPKSGKIKWGNNCCAWTVSTFLGIGRKNQHTWNKEGNAGRITDRLFAGNRKVTGKEGIVLGFEHFRRGDVLHWTKGKHTGIVNFNSPIKVYNSKGQFLGENRYIGIMDDGANLNATIVPVDRTAHTRRAFAKAMRNPTARKYMLKYNPVLREIWAFRSGNYRLRQLFRVKANTGWWGDSTTGRGSIMFATRTYGLTREAREKESQLLV